MISNQSNFISIVVPIYNEEGNLLSLIESISQSCKNFPFEILAINDGSTDGTLPELEECKKSNPKLKIINLKRNFGQTAAMAAGFDLAEGNIIIPLDGDGQNDPKDIPALIKKIDEGFDVVSGWRTGRKDHFINRRIPSWLANKLISLATGVKLHDYGCTLKAYKKSLIKDLQMSGEMHRFLPAWCVWQGGRVCELPVSHHPRVKGKSKYGIFRIVKVIIDLITLKMISGYLFKPNYLFSGSGLVSLFFSIVSVVIAFYDKFGPDRFPELRIPLLLLGVFFGMIGILLILMGFLAELLVRLYYQNLHKKPYKFFDE